MKERIVSLALGLALLLSGCAAPAAQSAGPELARYEASFLTLFDTVTSIVGYAGTEEAFQAEVQDFHDALEEYHKLFDAYNEYAGMNNIKTINDSAGGEAVPVDGRIIDLLLFCREVERLTDGRVDVTMGSVLSLWHDARERGINDP